IPVAPGRTRDLQVVLQEHALSVSSRIVDAEYADEGSGWLTHCTAVVAADDEPGVAVFDTAAVQRRCTQTLPARHVVDALASLGVAAMGFDWEIVELGCGEGELLARVRAEPDGATPSTWAGLLDAATSTASVVFDGAARLKMPARIERVQLHGAPQATAWIHVRRRPAETVADITI